MALETRGSPPGQLIGNSRINLNVCNGNPELRQHMRESIPSISGNSEALIRPSTNTHSSLRHHPGKADQMCDAFRPTLFDKCWGLGAAEDDPLLLGAPFVVALLTVLR